MLHMNNFLKPTGRWHSKLAADFLSSSTYHCLITAS